MEELRIRILEATIDIFNDKGWKFTMDDIAKELSISKKTIYKVFSDKEALFYAAVEHCFAAIKEAEKEIYEDDTLSIEEKVRKILIVLPNRYENIDFRRLSGAEVRYPEVVADIRKRLERDWDTTISILEEGIQQGVFRPVSITIIKIMVEATINKFLSSTELRDNFISYEEAMKSMVDVIIRGIQA